MRVPQTFTIDLSTVNKLEEYAKSTGTPKSHIVEEAILKLLKEKD